MHSLKLFMKRTRTIAMTNDNEGSTIMLIVFLIVLYDVKIITYGIHQHKNQLRLEIKNNFPGIFISSSLVEQFSIRFPFSDLIASFSLSRTLLKFSQAISGVFFSRFSFFSAKGTKFANLKLSLNIPRN